jgi:peptidoglycan L-alanyl-D-glutamate endopeptidase CwlK
MASRKLEDLLPGARKRAELFLDACKKTGVEVLIYCTFRSNAEQNELYKIGRSLPGDIVTNAIGGRSFHNYRLAFDFVPMIGGKPQWNSKKLYALCGEQAESVGLEWAGRWSGSLKETAHCQWTGGLKIAELQDGKLPAD